jgi:hypothetical protein
MSQEVSLILMSYFNFLVKQIIWSLLSIANEIQINGAYTANNSHAFDDDTRSKKYWIFTNRNPNVQ